MKESTIWNQLVAQGPFGVLAPMDDVTDVVFRPLVHALAPADLYMTEFASVEGFCSSGRPAIERRLHLASDEGPVIAQIWGTTPEHYRTMASELATRGFAGIDINMGCPVKDVTKTGACSALMQTPELAAEIIAATKQGAGELPVSVKTRLGWHKPAIEEWLGFLFQQDIAALTIHLRTVKEMSKVPAHWDLMPDVVKLRDRLAPHTVIVGNGDVQNRTDGQVMIKRFGGDGFMLGRGIFHNPWAFESQPREHSVEERLRVLSQHLERFEAAWPRSEKRYEPLKKFFKIYIQGFDGAAHLRAELMATKSLDQARELIKKYTPDAVSGV